MSDQRFTKIKFDGRKVRLEYERLREGADPDEFVLAVTEEPKQAFKDVLQSLVADVVQICEFHSEYGTRIRVRGVSLSYTNGIRGAVVTALRSLETSAAPLVLNTPSLPESPYSENGMQPLMSKAMIGRLDDLVEEATRFLDGEREQPSLGFGTDQGEDKRPEAQP